MKRIILMVAVVFAIVVTSCKNDHKHGPDTHEHEENTEVKADNDSDKKDIVMADAYKCPMDCEKGKTYEAEGKCPTCKMDLKKVEEKKGDNDKDHNEDHDEKKKHDHDEHAGHNH